MPRGIAKNQVAIDNNKLIKAMQDKDFGAVFISKVIGVDRTSIRNWTNGSVKRIGKDKYDSLCALLEVDSLMPDPPKLPEAKPYVAPSSSKEEVKAPGGMSDKEIELFREIIKAQGEQISELTKALNTAIDAFNNRSMEQAVEIGAISMELCDWDFKKFKHTATDKAKIVIDNHKAKYKSVNEVWSDVYKLLRAEYGIVWEQEKKEFKEINGYPCNSTLQLCYWIEANKPVYHGLFHSKLDTLAK